MIVNLTPKLTLSEIAEHCGGFLTVPDGEVSSIATDSREVGPQTLFLGFRGEHFDGAVFFPSVKAIGGYTLGNHDADISVDSTEAALLSLAAWKRHNLPHLMHTVAVTGSVGKTTARRILEVLLAKRFFLHATEGNFNSTVGMPLVILSSPPETELLLCECGMNRAGELSRLSRCLCPDLAMITNIGTAHIGNLGSRENIAKAKCEIREFLSPKRNLLYPYGEPLLDGTEGYTVGFSRDADFAFQIDRNSLLFRGESYPLPFRGEASVSCLIFAIAAAEMLGIGTVEMRERIECMDESLLRKRTFTCYNYTVIDDSYNASPESVAAALKELAVFPSRKYALLGDMLELGDHAPALHEKVGRLCAEIGLEKLFLYGRMAFSYRFGALAGGMEERKIEILPQKALPHEIADRILPSLQGGVILCKGSHASGLSDIISELKRSNP